MNILMVGSGKGSFEVRGRQLGAALGACVRTAPSSTDMQWADVVVLIKRAALQWATEVHRWHKPLVWDALDFWEQECRRSQNAFNEQQASALLILHITAISPTLVIGATEAMARAARGVYLPHHSRPGLTPAPARERVRVVGYEGQRKYLGRWAKTVQAECDRRGWQFVINPPDLRTCDILVAFRDGQWDGWMCREWKSGIKIVNAMAAGRPIITQDCAAFRELKPTGAFPVENERGLSQAFDMASDGFCAFTGISDDARNHTLNAVAEHYRAILQRVVEKAA